MILLTVQYAWKTPHLVHAEGIHVKSTLQDLADHMICQHFFYHPVAVTISPRLSKLLRVMK